jgi:hypothetical protein
VRIEARDESSFRASSATAKAKKPNNKKQENSLEFHSRLIEAPEVTSVRFDIEENQLVRAAGYVGL